MKKTLFIIPIVILIIIMMLVSCSSIIDENQNVQTTTIITENTTEEVTQINNENQTIVTENNIETTHIQTEQSSFESTSIIIETTKEDLPIEIAKEMRNAFWNEHEQDYIDLDIAVSKDKSPLIEFYGKYDSSYAIIFKPIGLVACTVIIDEYVSNYHFLYPDSATYISIYNSGRIYRLPEAYDNGVLTDEQVGELYNSYITANPHLAYKEKPIKEVMSEIRKAYWDSGRTSYNYLIGGIQDKNLYPSIMYYGKCGSTYAVIFDPGLLEPLMYSETVGKYTFKYNNFNIRLELFLDGKLYTLQEAYDNGIVSSNDLRLFNLNYNCLKYTRY